MVRCIGAVENVSDNLRKIVGADGTLIAGNLLGQSG